MLIVLPPSETKAPGGDGPALDPEGLSFPALNPVRDSLLEELSSLPVPEALEVLRISPLLQEEAEANLSLRSAPTMPALHRYTGVLFDALSAPTLPPHAWERLAVGSALFGVVRAGDLIPRYRLSGGTKLGGRTMRSRWGSLITEALAEEDFVVDLRSGAYQQLGRVPAAVTVRVEKDGKVVSHFNKHYKGELARVLAGAPEEAGSVADVIAIARDSGLDITQNSATELLLSV